VSWKPVNVSSCATCPASNVDRGDNTWCQLYEPHEMVIDAHDADTRAAEPPHECPLRGGPMLLQLRPREGGAL
jgi:hypothetical protein